MVDLYDDADVYDTLDQYDAGSGIATWTDTPLPHVRVLWRPEQFNRVAVGDFENGALGNWSVGAGINAAGTSITIVGTADYTGTHSAWVQAPATAGAGCHYDFGSDRFYDSALYGTAYVAVVYIRWVSGSKDVALVFGSQGTSDDRQTVRFEINSAWLPYKVVWLPHANRTDVQLAIVSQYAQACQFTIDAITVYQLDGFSQVENSCFLTDETGWSIDASINTVGDSLAALLSLIDPTLSSRDGDRHTCGRLSTKNTNGSGCHYDLGTRIFKTGRTYRARMALQGRSTGDTMSCRLRLGRISDAADRGDVTFTLSDQWDWYSVDWTPAVDCADAELAITNGEAGALIVNIDGVEVYEALDDVSAPYLSAMTWKRGTDGPGTLQATLNDAARRFDPRNTGSPLTGSVKAGRRIWARATYAGKLYPVAYGTIRQIVPRRDELQVDLMAEDPMYDLGRVTWTIGLESDSSYNTLRWWALNQTVLDGLSHYGTGVPFTRFRGASGLEDGNFASVADNVQVNDFLAALDEATGSEAVIRPEAEAEVMWRYTVTDRTTLTDASLVHETIDDDFAALEGFTVTDETLENHQQVPWQAYANIGDFGPLITAADVSVYGAADPEDPYWHFTSDAFGNDDNVPPPTYRTLKRQTRHGKAPRGKKKVTKVRVYPDPFVPFHMATGDTKTISVDFGCTVADCVVALTIGEDVAIINERETADHIEFTLLAMSPSTVDFVAVYGTPSRPTEETTATTIWHASAAADGDRLGPTIGTPYVSSKGAAQGLGQYRNWRYSVARMRPTMTVEHRFPSILQRDVNDHLAVTGPRYSLDAEPFLITGIEGSMSDGSRRWSMAWALEEIPTGGPWFTLDSSLLGTGSRPLAH